MKELTYKPIKNQEQYEEYADILYELMMQEEIDQLTQDHIDILLLLIKDWDSKTYDGKEYDPVEIIKSLIDDHGLSQKEFANIIDKSESYVSEILNYKKYPSKNVIRAISKHFKISQEALNKAYRLNLKKKENTVVVLGYFQKNQFLEGTQYLEKERTNPQNSRVALYKLKSTQYH
ncbi:MAG: helix-turn-helix domain-containing protein [Balneolaceae bacterium]|nr:helix-turn-helix domain-containing protein [Balneolaceae bacterium]